MSNKALRWAWSLALSPGLKLVLVRLADMANEKNECFPKQTTLAKDTGLSRSRISLHIRNLEQLGYLKQYHQRYKNGKRRASLYTLFVDADQSTVSQHCVLQPCESEHHHVSKQDSNNPHIEPSSKDICGVASNEQKVQAESNKTKPQGEGKAAVNDKCIKEILKKERRMDEYDEFCLNVMEVFQYWQKVMGHERAVLDEERIKVILKALLDYACSDLKKAIDGCKNTPYNMGDNPSKKRFDSIGLIFRNADQIERFIRNAKSSEKDKKREEMYRGVIV